MAEYPTIHSVLLSFVVVSVIVAAAVYLIADVNHNYGLNIDNSSFANTYNTADRVYNITRSGEADMFESDLSSDDLIDDMTTGGWGMLSKIVFGAPELLEAIMTDLALTLHIPPVFVRFAFAAFSILIISIALYYIMRVIT